MKIITPIVSIVALVVALAHAPQSSAASLRFTSGAVNNNLTNVTLGLAGPTNLVIQVERLNKTNDVWEAQGNLTLTNGVGTFNTTLVEGIYGFYRAKATNNTFFSTNAYGSVAGYLAPGLSMIGNIFGLENVTNILRNPVDGTQVYRWINPANSYTNIAYDASTHSWLPTTLSFDTTEGFFVRNPSTNVTMRYVVDGLFDTNVITTAIPTGLSIISTPLYHITVTNSWIVDTLTTNHVGGASPLPVISPGYSPQCWIYQIIDSAGHYQTNILGSNWTSSFTNVSVNLKLTEGFWIQKPTNATWSVSRPIW